MLDKSKSKSKANQKQTKNNPKTNQRQGRVKGGLGPPGLEGRCCDRKPLVVWAGAVFLVNSGRIPLMVCFYGRLPYALGFECRGRGVVFGVAAGL